MVLPIIATDRAGLVDPAQTNSQSDPAPVTLGFSVNELLPKARGGGKLRMGLVKLTQEEWRRPDPDLRARAAGFGDWPEGVQLTAEAEAPGEELAAMIGVEGALPDAALAGHEDLCLLTRSQGDDQYRLIGAAIAWPSDWHPKDKIGLPLRALHALEQLCYKRRCYKYWLGLIYECL